MEHYSDDELKARLTPEQFHVLREGGQEFPGTGSLLYNDRSGDYSCPVCGNVLFHSTEKYDSTTPGINRWPSFSGAASAKAVALRDDNRYGIHRIEVLCGRCRSHLGHLFDDAESPSGQHFCINSAALTFTENKKPKRTANE